MFRNELVSPVSSAVGEQEILVMLEALLKVEAPLKPLHRKIAEYISHCSSIELLSGLANHISDDIRCAVASNHCLTDELAWKLSEDKSFAVRARLAENKYLSTFLLETMAEDEDDHIAERALRALDNKKSESLTSRFAHWMCAALPSRQIS